MKKKLYKLLLFLVFSLAMSPAGLIAEYNTEAVAAEQEADKYEDDDQEGDAEEGALGEYQEPAAGNFTTLQSDDSVPPDQVIPPSPLRFF